MSDGDFSAGGSVSFFTALSPPSLDALTFSPLLTFTASPPLFGVTEAEPFVLTIDVALVLSTPTCVVDSESTTICVPGVRTDDS